MENFRTPPSTWCSSPPQYFTAHRSQQFEMGRAAYIDNAIREMRGVVDRRWRQAFEHREIVSITQVGERLVMVAADGTIWKKNPGKTRKMLTRSWWSRRHPAWSHAVEQFGRARDIHQCSLGILMSRLAEIPLWFPEGERFSDAWVQAFTSSVELSIRQRGNLYLEETLPDNLLDAMYEEVEKFNTDWCG